jgi:hypothetical protein
MLLCCYAVMLLCWYAVMLLRCYAEFRDAVMLLCCHAGMLSFVMLRRGSALCHCTKWTNQGILTEGKGSGRYQLL